MGFHVPHPSIPACLLGRRAVQIISLTPGRAMSPREIRKARGLTVERAAVAGGVTSPTLRMYEANRDAVSDATRRKLDVVYEGWRASLPAAPNPSAPTSRAVS
ncbi:MAG: XRE family transcriptional regulator [Myxococcales bacterium]|nr:MAG: XRE family transcriptional regulator [Myxococcales bacterium]